jgi:hypothetical protein
MAYVLTYDTLTASVTDYVERTDNNFISQIPLFIMLGERRVARDLKILGLRVIWTDTMLAGQEFIQKPARWLNNSTFNIGTGTGFNTRVQVLERSYEFCRMYWPNPTLTGQPKYYCDYNYDNWLISPTPDDVYPYEVFYYETPQLIDATDQTNWLTSNAPEVLLYGTLLETAVYLKDDDRIGAWTDYYNKARANITEEDMKRIYDGYSKRGG